MKSLIVFAGAGSSYGISKEKYPMTLEFKNKLPEDIKKSHLFTQLISHLNQPAENIDIEHILWELGKLKNVLNEMTSKENFISYLLTTNQINQFPGHTHYNGQSTHAQLASLQTINSELINKINERVYDFYAQAPTDEELAVSWTPLLEHIKKSNFHRTDIFTTNYDLIIESALIKANIDNINNGFIEGITPGINLDYWKNPESSSLGMLTKLHGSVDWKLGNGGTDTNPVIRRGLLEFEGDHDKRLILYPGFKGVPTREPFAAFHNYFKERLKDASHILFIGFAFRDEFINNLISENKMSSCKIAVVDPTKKLPELPFLKNANHIKQAFGSGLHTSLLSIDGMTPFSVKDLAKWLS